MADEIKQEDKKKFILFRMLDSTRYTNILRSVQVTMTILLAYFLGINSMIWMQGLIEDYAYQICNIVSVNHTYVNPFTNKSGPLYKVNLTEISSEFEISNATINVLP